MFAYWKYRQMYYEKITKKNYISKNKSIYLVPVYISSIQNSKDVLIMST